MRCNCSWLGLTVVTCLALAMTSVTHLPFNAETTVHSLQAQSEREGKSELGNTTFEGVFCVNVVPFICRDVISVQEHQEG